MVIGASALAQATLLVGLPLQLRWPGPTGFESLGLGIQLHVGPDVPDGWRLVMVAVGHGLSVLGALPLTIVDLVGGSQ